MSSAFDLNYWVLGDEIFSAQSPSKDKNKQAFEDVDTEKATSRYIGRMLHIQWDNVPLGFSHVLEYHQSLAS